MNIEKLKPWNWFKHENDETNQVPVSKNNAPSEGTSQNKLGNKPQAKTAEYLLQLHHEMDRLFDDAWRSVGVPSNLRLKPSLLDGSLLGDYRAKLDISGSDKEYEISIDLPGLSENDIQIDLSGNTLKVTGLKEEKNETKDRQYYRVERSIGSFQRTLSLPEDANRDQISAKMKNGLLLINIPRKAVPSGNVKRISISS